MFSYKGFGREVKDFGVLGVYLSVRLVMVKVILESLFGVVIIYYLVYGEGRGTGRKDVRS